MSGTVTEIEIGQVASSPRHDTAETSPKSGPSTTPGQPADVLNITEPAEGTAAEDESHYPTGLKLLLILFCAGLVLILDGLDASIVSVAVPSITDHFHTVADVGWYSAAYRLCSCSFQFMFGKLYRVFPVKAVFLLSVVIFMLGSLLCAAAPSSAAFVAGRAVCGFANSGIIAGCFTLLVYCLPLRRRPLFAGILGSVEGGATIAAPILGGVIVESLGWRWCFWISLPIGAVTLAGLFFFLAEIKPQEQLTLRQKLQHLDLVGTAVFVPSLTCLFLALSWAGARYRWDSPVVIGLFCGFAILLCVFAWDQRRKGDAATLPPRILRNRSVLAGFVFSFCCNAALNVVEYYLPTYFQAVRDYSPARSGYLMLPSLGGYIAATLAHGSGVSMLGYCAPFMLASSLVLPVSAGLMTTLAPDTALARTLCYAGLYGFAGGIGFQGPQSAVQAALPAGDASVGLAIIIFAQQAGPAVFVSAAQSVFVNRLATNLAGLAPGLNVTDIASMGLGDLRGRVGPDELAGVLKGLDRSLVQTWYIAVALAVVTMAGSASMEWRSVKQKRS
ncbi:Major facilitator superfamily domain, general substrate transporter [Pleurostoma richardsiae]|uniref:Major facilitator superfamily domain, general substrate transporter n=1 Tax=Pleurostoma richardsiae TaxID=41990 RepID=A0AA38S1R6_9PEZI|nr:Major facilitator superfamily domain, general substrate transporter [Pleurostoma richardsiae]